MFPSWTSIVLLIWSCVVWVTPRFNAKDAVYHTTPGLVLYAIVLLVIQYLYNFDLTEEELESNTDAGLVRYYEPPTGAPVLTIALKVNKNSLLCMSMIFTYVFCIVSYAVFIHCYLLVLIERIHIPVQESMGTLLVPWNILFVTP